MKKKLNSSSKRKWVLNGVLMFGAVALLTTGFATWVVGSKVTEADNGTSVTVDTASNDTVRFSMTLNEGAVAGSDLSSKYSKAGNAIQLKEPNKPTGHVKVTDGGDLVNADDALTITTKEIKVVVGDAWLAKNTIKGIKFAIKYEADGTEDPDGNQTVDLKDNALNKVTSDKDLIKNDIKSAETSGRPTLPNSGKDYWTYVDAPDNFTFNTALTAGVENGDWSIVGEGTSSTKTYTYKVSSFTFNWGSFFNGKAPSAFYDEAFKHVDTAAESDHTDSFNGHLTDELNAMHEALNIKNIVLSASLITGVVA